MRSKRKRTEPSQAALGVPAAEGDTIDVVVVNPGTGPSTDLHSPRDLPPNSLSKEMQSWAEPWAPVAAWQYDIPMLDGTLSTLDELVEEGASTSSIDTSMGSGEVHHVAGRTTDAPGAAGNSIGSSASSHVSSSGSVGFSVEGRSVCRRDAALVSSPIAATIDLDRALPTPHSCSARTPCRPEASAREPKPPVEPGLQHSEKELAKLDSRCVLICVHILATLENYLLSELKALDLILEAIRKATAELKKLVQLQEQSRSDRCIILFTAIMFQVTALLEAGAKPLPGSEGDALEGFHSGFQTSLVPALGFGAFSLSREHQRELQSQIVLREYRHVGEVLSSVMLLARRGPRGASHAPDMVEQRTRSLSSLEQKLKGLCEQECGETL
jgi:hypothetical protein